MFPWSTRLQLALVLAAVGVAVQVAVGRHKRLLGVPMGRPTERDRGWKAGVRVGCAGVALGCIGVVLGGTDPAWVLGATGLGTTLPSFVLGVARWRMAARHRPPAPGWPWLVSMPLHILNGAVVAIAAILFAWMLPKLPSVVPLHWAPLGDSGYGSPTKLWWSLTPIAANTILLWVAARQLAGTRSWRRLALLRFTETLLVGFDLAIVVVWLGAAASGRPEVRLLRTSLLVAGAIVGLALLVALVSSTLTRRLASSRDTPWDLWADPR